MAYAMTALALLLSVASAADAVPPTVQEMIGGGNLEASLAGPGLQPMFDALHGVGAGMGRINSYAWRSLDRRPTPRTLDAAVAQAWRNGIRPMILLEYYGHYRRAVPPQPIGSYNEWFAAGVALADRFRPGGTWSAEHHAMGWGITVFAAMNEPDVERSIPFPAYRDALAGLADGVHSVDPRLKVIPGGFATCNSHWDATLGGYGPALTGLLNAGKLDGIDLHTYYHDHWFPLEKGRHFSAQACFDAVKKAAGVSRDIAFYATEMNVAKVGWPDPAMDDTTAARQFLTGLWDHLGVVGQDGHQSVAEEVFPWNLAELRKGPGSIYAMALHHRPWIGDSRAAVLRIVLQLTAGLRVRSADVGRGEVVLDGESGTLLVWHDRAGWTDHPGDHVRLGVPLDMYAVEVWDAGGIRQRLDTVPGSSIEIGGLPVGQTYMFRFRR